MSNLIDFMRKVITKAALGSAIVFYSSLISAPLKAAEWSLSPVVGVAGEYGDNVALLPNTTDNYWRFLVIPSLKMLRQDGNTKLSLHTFLDFKYSGDDELTDQSQRVYLKYAYTAERHRLGVKGFFKREGVLKNITAEVDPDDIEGSDLENADTSVLQFQSRRTVLDMKPYWSWKLSELDTLKVQYRFVDTGYSTVLFSDQRRHTLLTSLSHQLTQNLDAILNLSGSQFNNLDDKSTVDNRQASFGVNYKFSDRFSGNAQIGFRKSSAGSVDSSGIIYQIAGNKKTEVGSLNVLARRNVRSSGKETSTLADELKVWWKNKIRPTVDFSLYLNTYQNKKLTGDSSSQIYFGLQPRLSWQLSFEWAMAFSYEFRRLKDHDDAVAKSNSVAIAISYALPKASVSR